MTKMSSGFCMCFVPVVSDNVTMIGDEKSNKSSLFYSPAKNTTESDEKDKIGGFVSFGRKNKHGRGSLNRYFKAVFFETSLMKKIRSKKLGQKLHRIYSGEFNSKPKSKSKPKKIIKSREESTRSNVSSNVASNLSSSSSLMMASSISYGSRPPVTKTVGNNDMQGRLGTGNGKGGHGFSIGICCLFIISLWAIVIWGKVCAIFYTSIVLLFANRWIKSIKPCPISDNIVVDRCLPEIDSEVYKKKIIMEGFLERNRSPNLC